EGDQLVAFDSAAGVHKYYDKALALGVEIRISGDMQPPVISRRVRRVADFHLLGHRALAKSDHLEFLRLLLRRSFFLSAFGIEDEVTGFLSLRCRVNHQLA